MYVYAINKIYHIYYRDVALLGNCDDVINELCEKLGWKDDLDELVTESSKIFSN